MKKRSRSNNKDVRDQLKEAAPRDRDLTREVMDDWAAVDRESGQQMDREEKRTAGRSAGKVKRTRSLREIKAYIHNIASPPDCLKKSWEQAKRNGNKRPEPRENPSWHCCSRSSPGVRKTRKHG